MDNPSQRGILVISKWKRFSWCEPRRSLYRERARRWQTATLKEARKEDTNLALAMEKTLRSWLRKTFESLFWSNPTHLQSTQASETGVGSGWRHFKSTFGTIRWQQPSCSTSWYDNNLICKDVRACIFKGN